MLVAGGPQPLVAAAAALAFVATAFCSKGELRRQTHLLARLLPAWLAIYLACWSVGQSLAIGTVEVAATGSSCRCEFNFLLLLPLSPHLYLELVSQVTRPVATNGHQRPSQTNGTSESLVSWNRSDRHEFFPALSLSLTRSASERPSNRRAYCCFGAAVATATTSRRWWLVLETEG